MKKDYSFRLISIYTIATIIGLVVFGGIMLYGQEAHPFYLDLLRKGEKSFLARNYEDAVRELEIAIFGPLGNTKLRAKAYIYLSISHYYLENIEKSEKYLKDAENLIENKEFTNLEIAKPVLSEFQELVNYFKRRRIQKERTEGLTLRNRKPEDKKSQNIAERLSINTQEKYQKNDDRNPVKILEMKIKSDPQNTALYFELFELYRKYNNLRAGKGILKKLIKKNPAEVKGYYLLGIMYYEERKYKDAENNFVKIFELTKNILIDKNLLGEAGAYLILSTYLQGDRKGASMLFAGLMTYLPEEKISSPSLNEKDKAILQEIIETYKRRSEADISK